MFPPIKIKELQHAARSHKFSTGFGRDGFHFTLPLDFTDELCAMTFDWIFAGDAHAYSVVGELRVPLVQDCKSRKICICDATEYHKERFGERYWRWRSTTPKPMSWMKVWSRLLWISQNHLRRFGENLSWSGR